MSVRRWDEMCFDHDSRPPIAPMAGAAIDSTAIELVAGDGNHFAAFRADASEVHGKGIVILPDVRGLYPFYEELALRFAEVGVDAIAIDYYGRTAGPSRRDASFDPSPHTTRTTWAGLQADVAAAVAHLAAERAIARPYAVGFCFGGRLSFLLATVDALDLAGVIGFYGPPVGPSRNDTPAPADVAARVRSPLLGLFGAADPGIPHADVEAFRRALHAAGAQHRIVEYPGAPHSFFDRKQDQFREASKAAWSEVLAFMGSGR